MEAKIKEIAERIYGLRILLELSQEEMAEKTATTLEEYRQFESGEADFGFTFLYDCARAFGVDIVELLTGEKPRLKFYTVVRAGEGLPMKRRQGFTYQHLAFRIKDKLSEPFMVTAPYDPDEQNKPIHLSRHEGQEFDYIMKGALKVQLEDHVEVLTEGDSIFYDSGHGHGMIATGGADCTFLAFVMKPHTEKE